MAFQHWHSGVSWGADGGTRRCGDPKWQAESPQLPGVLCLRWEPGRSAPPAHSLRPKGGRSGWTPWGPSFLNQCTHAITHFQKAFLRIVPPTPSPEDWVKIIFSYRRDHLRIFPHFPSLFIFHLWEETELSWWAVAPPSPTLCVWELREERSLLQCRALSSNRRSLPLSKSTLPAGPLHTLPHLRLSAVPSGSFYLILTSQGGKCKSWEVKWVAQSYPSGK